MNRFPEPLDLQQLKVRPLAERHSLSTLEKILLDPDESPPPCSAGNLKSIRACARQIAQARARHAGVILMYGAHLVKNGAQRIVNSLIEDGWITHLATNGAGAIHDWELAFLGRTEESVRQNVATGTFGAWAETGRNLHLAALTGALRPEGYGRSLGRLISDDGLTLPAPRDLEAAIRDKPADPLTPARAELLLALLKHNLASGRVEVNHPWKKDSILARSFQRNVPLTVHPGIGYDIIANHPMFNGAALGRAAEMDFKLLAASVDTLDGGVVISVGSAIMAPQVFEKSLSCVNNLRLQTGRKIVEHPSFYVVDIQDGGRWDWSKGEPPKDNSAYYLRFCKSFSRMGGNMDYLQCDNVAFLHHLLRELRELAS